MGMPASENVSERVHYGPELSKAAEVVEEQLKDPVA